MQEKIPLQKNSIIIVAVVLALMGGGYFYFTSSEDDTATAVKGVANLSMLSKDIQALYASKSKISLSDVSFTKSYVYEELEDYTVDISKKDPPGRPNPFVPYVAP